MSFTGLSSKDTCWFSLRQAQLWSIFVPKTTAEGCFHKKAGRSEMEKGAQVAIGRVEAYVGIPKRRAQSNSQKTDRLIQVFLKRMRVNRDFLEHFGPQLDLRDRD